MRRAQPWLGTLVDITIGDALDDIALMSCFNAAFARIAKVHRLMSFHDLNSDVSRINRASVGDTINIDPLTDEVIRTALAVAEASGGIFDINCAAKLIEWGYLPRLEEVLLECPSGRRCAVILESDYKAIKTEPACIDLGGIAKGYAVDLAIEELKQLGVQSACVNAGGDLRVIGDIAYSITIRHAERPTEAAGRIQIQDEALATSAGYFSRKSIDGREVSPLVNGKTGAPVTSTFSASVSASTCMVADALTKIVSATGDVNHPALTQFDATAFIT